MSTPAQGQSSLIAILAQYRMVLVLSISSVPLAKYFVSQTKKCKGMSCAVDAILCDFEFVPQAVTISLSKIFLRLHQTNLTEFNVHLFPRKKFTFKPPPLGRVKYEHLKMWWMSTTSDFFQSLKTDMPIPLSHLLAANFNSFDSFMDFAFEIHLDITRSFSDFLAWYSSYGVPDQIHTNPWELQTAGDRRACFLAQDKARMGFLWRRCESSAIIMVPHSVFLSRYSQNFS